MRSRSPRKGILVGGYELGRVARSGRYLMAALGQAATGFSGGIPFQFGSIWEWPRVLKSPLYFQVCAWVTMAFLVVPVLSLGLLPRAAGTLGVVCVGDSSGSMLRATLAVERMERGFLAALWRGPRLGRRWAVICTSCTRWRQVGGPGDARIWR